MEVHEENFLFFFSNENLQNHEKTAWDHRTALSRICKYQELVKFMNESTIDFTLNAEFSFAFTFIEFSPATILCQIKKITYKNSWIKQQTIRNMIILISF